MKILHSEFQDKIGGIETFLLNINRANGNNADIKFDFIFRGENQAIETKLKKFGGNIFCLPKGTIKKILFLCKVVKNGNYDIIHIHKNSAANIIFPIISKIFSRSKIIIHSHNTSPSENKIIYKIAHYFNKPILNIIADYKIACSALAGKWLFTKKNLKVTIINNGLFVDDYKFDNEIRLKVRKELNIVENDKVLGNVSAFRLQKNHKFMVDILYELKVQNVKLLLVGDGQLKEIIKNYSRKIKVDDKIIFYGDSKNVNQLLMAMDIFIMPSFYEGLPIAAIEAQASGLPVLLSSNISKQTKIAKDVRFIDINDATIWAKEIENISPKSHRENAVHIVSDRGFNICDSYNELVNIYKKLID